MSKSKKSKVSAAAAESKRRRQRASYIRTKIAEGKPTDDEERTFLADYDAEPHGNAVAVEEPPADAPPDTTPPDAPAPEQVPLDFRTPPPPLEPLPGFDSLPPPPRYKGAPPAKGGGKWQDKYSAGEDGHLATPRESTCLYVASLWHGALVQVSASIKEAGIDPIVDVEKLRGALVLATDEILPQDIVLTPTIIAGVGSSALLAQRMMRAKEIKAAQDAKKLRSAPSASVYVPPAPEATPYVAERVVVEEPAPTAPEPEPITAPRANGFDRGGLL